MPAKLTTIGQAAFQYTELTGLDLSNATSLVEIGGRAFADTNLEGTLVIPPTVATIGHAAFQYTKLTHLDLSKAPSLAKIGDGISATRSSNQ